MHVLMTLRGCSLTLLLHKADATPICFRHVAAQVGVPRLRDLLTRQLRASLAIIVAELGR